MDYGYLSAILHLALGWNSAFCSLHSPNQDSADTAHTVLYVPWCVPFDTPESPSPGTGWLAIKWLLQRASDDHSLPIHLIILVSYVDFISLLLPHHDVFPYQLGWLGFPGCIKFRGHSALSYNSDPSNSLSS